MNGKKGRRAQEGEAEQCGELFLLLAPAPRRFQDVGRESGSGQCVGRGGVKCFVTSEAVLCGWVPWRQGVLRKLLGIQSKTNPSGVLEPRNEGDFGLAESPISEVVRVCRELSLASRSITRLSEHEALPGNWEGGSLTLDPGALSSSRHAKYW